VPARKAYEIFPKKAECLLRIPYFLERGKSPTQKKGVETHNFASELLSSPPKQRKKFGTRSFELVVAQQQ
jgi:hypothetical protein